MGLGASVSAQLPSSGFDHCRIELGHGPRLSRSMLRVAQERSGRAAHSRRQASPRKIQTCLDRYRCLRGPRVTSPVEPLVVGEIDARTQSKPAMLRESAPVRDATYDPPARFRSACLACGVSSGGGASRTSCEDGDVAEARDVAGPSSSTAAWWRGAHVALSVLPGSLLMQRPRSGARKKSPVRSGRKRAQASAYPARRRFITVFCPKHVDPSVWRPRRRSPRPAARFRLRSAEPSPRVRFERSSRGMTL